MVRACDPSWWEPAHSAGPTARCQEPLARAAIASARPWQSYRPLAVVVDEELVVTGVQVCATAFIAVVLPVRPSLPPKPPPVPSVTTQRIFPERTASASQVRLTSLSRPEKPPIPATSLRRR